MRLVFVATGEIALPTFRHLLANGPRPLALVTQPDKPVGRHHVMTPPAIKLEALAAGMPVYQPEKIGSICEELGVLDPEVIVVMAYGQILRRDILKLPSKAIINLHASLLPLYRGAACIQAAIDAGDGESGITAMHVIRELDAGNIIFKKAIELAPDETGGSLHDRLADLAPVVLAETLVKLADGTAESLPQDVKAVSYVTKLEREDGRLDWSKPAIEIERRIRAYDPWPGTYTVATEEGRERRLKIFPPTRVVEAELAVGELAWLDGYLVIGCGSGGLQLQTLQPDGARRMAAGDYWRGHRPKAFAQPT